MAQTYTADCYASAHVVDTDMTNVEANFAALKSSFSGAAAPGNTVGGMLWLDTSAAAKYVLKCRNAGDTAWLGLMHGDVNQKVLVYRNAAMNGWAIDGGATDRVVALKGGGTYVAGGAAAGSWTLPDYTLLEADLPAHTHTINGSGTHTHTDAMLQSLKGAAGSQAAVGDGAAGGNLTVDGGGDHDHGGATVATGGDTAHNHGATYRPAAVVCTMQYLNL